MSLRDYARKRRLGTTPEPSGGDAGPGTRPVYVVQLHHASTRHYDFRLEIDGVLKSWAVPKGPSLRAGEKRLAVEVEDHPLDYATFEGDIPRGHYGAGHVEVFDRGHWACDGDPLALHAKGKLEFTLSGGKLSGGWSLVRTRMRGRQRQWLLIKRDDAHAADLEADDLVDRDGRRKSRGRAAESDAAATGRIHRTSGAEPKPGVRRARHTRKKNEAGWRDRALALKGALDGAMPIGFDPALTILQDAPPAGDRWLHELKWDGYRLLVDLVDGGARLRSRNGLDWTGTFPEIAAAVESLPVGDACLDGELVVLDADGHSDFSELQRVIEGSSRAPLRYLLFDLPGLAGVDLRKVALTDRKALLKDLLGDGTGALAYSEHVIGHGAQVFEQTARAGIEGLVSKRVGSAYRSGRSGDWVKSKHARSDEFVIVGYTRPKGSRSGFGSLLLASRHDGGLAYMGRVGTGFGSDDLKRILERLRKIRARDAPFDLPGHVRIPRADITWVRPREVAEVAFRGHGKEGLLRQASFLRMRPDKTPEEVGNDRDTAKRTATDRKPERATSTHEPETTVKLTHPDRVMFADAAHTKQDVADYYRSVADWLLPELVGRPLSLLRCPDGSQSECFFQKHHSDGLGDHVHPVPLQQKSGGREDYLYVDAIEGVIELVQMNTIEFHPWGATVEAPERPDRMVFDLDPGEGVAWKTMIAAARDVRDRLAWIDLESFVRLSGGKGLHVVVPIAPGPSWDEVRRFCEGFAVAMATQAPDRYLASMAKAKRKGRIFIDWLRNARGATSVASWSLRARPGAPVAMPLRWDELGRIRAPDAYDLTRARRRAASLGSDPWQGISTLRQSLPDL
ncbi:DNA ligase D [Marilutibacter chinensis]|uniref:DNA ligase (ATP) n=1 Tax=Marilutibacter chinensis TaxID=2912247 RepID=A0ABS9HQC0_9GAMM|nr:DNA ligase D [Lysobacter chinensis]MCF7221136.1 DNA ligase D [Lysobacter chinensis]